MRSRRFWALRERLLRAGVAPRGVRRVIGELNDHFDDVLAELAAQGVNAKDAPAQAYARLGSEDVLVRSILARPELLSWAHRRPAVAFALLPVPAFAAAFVASIVALVGSAHLARAWFAVRFVDSAGLQLLTRCFSLWILWLLPTAVSMLSAWAAWRRRIALLWPSVGILIVGALGALTNFGVHWATATSRGAVGAGIGFGPANELPALVRAASTLAASLLVYAGCWLANRRGSQPPRGAGTAVTP